MLARNSISCFEKPSDLALDLAEALDHGDVLARAVLLHEVEAPGLLPARRVRLEGAHVHLHDALASKSASPSLSALKVLRTVRA